MTAEIHLLGTGGGWGESIIINLGNNDFIIIDSCINPLEKKPLPLTFLKEKEIPLENVKLIICTHWHDDHIRGMSELFNECKKSQFCFTKIHDFKKFFRLLSFDYKKSDKNISNSSTLEFNKCLQIIEERSLMGIQAYPNRVLYSNQVNNIDIEVRSISPSDYSIQLFDSKSIAIFLKLGKHCVILGSDLEINSDRRLGWGAIIDSSKLVKIEKANYFKIPHHGSENGYSLEVWNDLLEPNSESSLTPYNKGKKLPTKAMLNKYLSHSPNLHITSSLTISSKPKKRDHNIEKVISSFATDISEIRYSYGVVSSKIDISNEEDKWQTSYIGTAKQIS
jgi:hypothetical protein